MDKCICCECQDKRLAAANGLAELVELFIEDPHEKVIYPAFIARSFTVYECRYCGREARTPDKICHADDCLFERSRIALDEYREVKE